MGNNKKSKLILGWLELSSGFSRNESKCPLINPESMERILHHFSPFHNSEEYSSLLLQDK